MHFNNLKIKIMYYIISLKHTSKEDKFITLWRENNQGYCQSKHVAGIYENYIEGYHNSDANMPISTEEADKLFVLNTDSGQGILYLPNNKLVLGKLGLEFKKRKLTKITI